MVAYTSNSGKQIFRNYVVPKDPKTPKQLTHRMKFGLVNRVLSPLNGAIKLGHKGNANAYRSIVSMVFREAILGEYPNLRLDYSKIKIADGMLMPPSGLRREIGSDNRNIIFSWNSENECSDGPFSDFDLLNIVALNVNKNSVFNFQRCGYRKNCKVELYLPIDWLPHDTHFWAYFACEYLQMNSVSVYVEQ